MDISNDFQAEQEPVALAETWAQRLFRFKWGAWAWLAALFALLFYLPTVDYALVWDDTIFLRDTPLYRQSGLTALFEPFVLSPNYFRPCALLTFWLELRLVELDPSLFHLVNVLLHALNTALVALLAGQLGRKNKLWVLAGGLLYGLHPALIEGVAFISSRFDLLMTTFLLLALLTDSTRRGRQTRPLWVGLAFLLAALCKEMALALVFALPCWHLALQEQSSVRRVFKDNRKMYAAVFAAGLLYLGIRYASLGYVLSANAESSIATGSLVQHFFLFVKSFAAYLLLFVWPFNTLAPIHYSQLPVSASDPLVWGALALLAAFVAGLVWLLRRSMASHLRMSAWLALGGALALLPVCNLLPLELGGGAFIAERFLLFPLVFWSLATVSLLSPLYRAGLGRTPERLPWRMALPLLWLLAAVAVLQLTLPHWRDNMSLWTWAAGRAPRSATPFTNLALEHIESGYYERGLQLAQQAIDLDPQNADAWDNAGLAWFYLGRYEQAQHAFEEAISLQPENALFWNNLAGALREQDALAEAERLLLDQALQLAPDLPSAHLNLGIVYLRADRPDLAAIALQEAVRLLPTKQAADAQELLAQTKDPTRWLRLGDLLLNYGELEGALRAFEQSAELGAPLADVSVGFSAALIGLGDWQRAANVLTQALEVAPQDPRLYNNLGIVAREQGDLAAARQLFGRAAELAPEWEQPRLNLDALDEP